MLFKNILTYFVKKIKQTELPMQCFEICNAPLFYMKHKTIDLLRTIYILKTKLFVFNLTLLTIHEKLRF